MVCHCVSEGQRRVPERILVDLIFWITCGIVRAALVNILPSRSACYIIDFIFVKMTDRIINKS